jgi:hypothetical protein
MPRASVTRPAITAATSSRLIWRQRLCVPLRVGHPGRSRLGPRTRPRHRQRLHRRRHRRLQPVGQRRPAPCSTWPRPRSSTDSASAASLPPVSSSPAPPSPPATCPPGPRSPPTSNPRPHRYPRSRPQARPSPPDCRAAAGTREPSPSPATAAGGAGRSRQCGNRAAIRLITAICATSAVTSMGAVGRAINAHAMSATRPHMAAKTSPSKPLS